MQGDVTINTAFTPEIRFNISDPAAVGTSPAIRLIKPTIAIDTGLGVKTYAPYGESSGEYLPYVLIGLAALAYLVYRAISK